jgi:hypothetical protein
MIGTVSGNIKIKNLKSSNVENMLSNKHNVHKRKYQSSIMNRQEGTHN